MHKDFTAADINQPPPAFPPWDEVDAAPYEAGAVTLPKRGALLYRYDLAPKLERWRGDVLAWIANRLPRSIAYWCAIRVGVHATTGRWEREVVPELFFVDALERWHKR